MLVLSRRNQESVMVGGGGSFPGLLKVTVLEVTSGKVKLGFEVAPDVPVHRLELWERMRARGELECLTADGPPAQVELG
jgi:carbon storage regulator CsrA